VEVFEVPSTIKPQTGIAIDRDRLDYELARRGATARQLANGAGIPEVTLSRARHGRRVTEKTFRKLAAALLEIPIVVGGDLLLAAPKEKAARALIPAASDEEVGRVSGAS
jgi:transcriptional regulator with XRE-family HTH domain